MHASTKKCLRKNGRDPRSTGSRIKSNLRTYAAFIVIFFSAFCASVLLGKVTVRTPFLKLMSILSVSTPPGT